MARDYILTHNQLKSTRGFKKPVDISGSAISLIDSVEVNVAEDKGLTFSTELETNGAIAVKLAQNQKVVKAEWGKRLPGIVTGRNKTAK